MKHVICIVGPTAVGKSALALQLAQALNTEILSSDSRQMYRYMDIGTAKPTPTELSQVTHHFINTLDPDQVYNAAQFEEEADARIQTILQSKDQLLIVGGSTLYMNALWYGFDEMPAIPPAIREGLNQEFREHGLPNLLEELEQNDPLSFEQIDRKNHARVIRALEVFRATGKPISFFRTGITAKSTHWNWIKIGLTDDRSRLYERIDRRVVQMLESGLEEEVTKLKNEYGDQAPGLQSIGYSEMIAHLNGDIDAKECVRLIQRNSRRYAKRQLTWFRRYEDIRWFETAESPDILPWVQEQMKHV